MMTSSITDVPGIRVGQVERAGGGWLTGVTVVLPPPGTVGAVDVRGGAPATHETDALFVRLHEYAESSAVAVLVTADLGLARAVAKGAKRTANSFKGPLDRGILYRVRLGRRGATGSST